MNRSSIIWSETLRLAPDGMSAREARDFVGRHLTSRGLPDLVEGIRLVVSELVTNALVHALPPVVVHLQEQRLDVLLAVSDRSPELPVSRPHQPTDLSGRGLDIVDQVSSEWG